MKKIFSSVVALILIFSLYSCKNDNTLTSFDNTQKEIAEDWQNQSIVLPKKDVLTVNADDTFKKVTIRNFVISERVQNYWFGIKSKHHSGGIDDTELLIDTNTNKELSLKYPKKFPTWQVSSGAYVVLNERYLYEWRSYPSEFEEDTKHNMKLTRLDVKSGKISIVCEVKLDTPLVYLCKIDDSHFLSYYTVKAQSNRVEYATLTVAEIYNVNGTKTEIIREKYENDVNWTDSEGILLERLTIVNGEIYGFGRRQIGGKYQFFLYRYDKNGKLLETQSLPSFDKIISNEQPFDFNIIDNYIIFKTYESLTSYICKLTDNGVKLIAKGENGSLPYGYYTNSNKNSYIFFIETNVNDDATIKDKACPLYILDVQSGTIKALNFTISLYTPYFVNFKVLLNGDLLFTYCEKQYDPMNQEQFILTNNDLNKIIELY